MMNKPHTLWVILDELDGPHLFRYKRDAWRMYRKWERGAKANRDTYGGHDSFWDMSEPLKYVPVEESDES